jgi:hypothetical protein
VPHLQRLYAKYKHHGLEIVGFNYERGARAEQATVARKFAAEHGITYHLALGDPALQRQVPNFKGFPTLLFFKKGLQFSHLAVGFEPAHAVEFERWVATELGLPVKDIGPAEPPAGKPPAEAEAEQPEQEFLEEPMPEDVEVPAGAIYKPGQGDTGFDFESNDVAGALLRFRDLRGKPVVLALTTTWDSEAGNTAQLIARVAKELGDKAHVIAASFERSKDAAANAIAIKEFMTKHGVSYRAFAATLALQKKIYLFTGVPMFLVFDSEGKLVLREGGGAADELCTKLVEAAR